MSKKPDDGARGDRRHRPRGKLVLLVGGALLLAGAALWFCASKSRTDGALKAVAHGVAAPGGYVVGERSWANLPADDPASAPAELDGEAQRLAAEAQKTWQNLDIAVEGK